MMLSDIVRQCEYRFGIRVIKPWAHEGRSRVFLATRADEDLVLKIAINTTEAMREIRALEAFSHHGAIGLIDYDEKLSALILQRAVPGYPLSSISDDDRATAIFCAVFQQLHLRPITGPHESIQKHVSAIAQYLQQSAPQGPLPEAWVARAFAYLNELIASTSDSVLLHGDLHHTNILRHQGDWIVIDPKGILGDLHFDVIAYLLNFPTRQGDAETVLSRRMAMLAERLGLQQERIAMWGVAKGILDACWALEEGSDWQSGLHTAERFERWLAHSSRSQH